MSLKKFTELELGTPCVVEMQKQQTILHQPSALDKVDRYVFFFLLKIYNTAHIILLKNRGIVRYAFCHLNLRNSINEQICSDKFFLLVVTHSHDDEIRNLLP